MRAPALEALHSGSIVGLQGFRIRGTYHAILFYTILYYTIKYYIVIYHTRLRGTIGFTLDDATPDLLARIRATSETL